MRLVFKVLVNKTLRSWPWILVACSELVVYVPEQPQLSTLWAAQGLVVGMTQDKQEVLCMHLKSENKRLVNTNSHFRAVGMSSNSLHESDEPLYMSAFFLVPSALPVVKISPPFLRDTMQCP